jgi:hypothetical protein
LRRAQVKILLLSLETIFCRGLLVATDIADLYDPGLSEMRLQLLASCIYNVFIVNWDIIKT